MKQHETDFLKIKAWGLSQLSSAVPDKKNTIIFSQLYQYCTFLQKRSISRLSAKDIRSFVMKCIWNDYVK